MHAADIRLWQNWQLNGKCFDAFSIASFNGSFTFNEMANRNTAPAPIYFDILLANSFWTGRSRSIIV